MIRRPTRSLGFTVLPAALLAALLLAACAHTTTVPLLAAAGIPVTLTPANAVPLEVVTRGTGVPDPLPVRGSSFVYADLEAALSHAVATAAVPWAEHHRDRTPDGYQLFVELIKAEANHDSGRMVVTLGVRATLRSRARAHDLGQTQAYCRDAALVPPDGAAPVIYTCMTRIGRDLTAWLGALQP